MLATILRPTYGTARVDGIDVAAEPQLVRERVAYLGHGAGLYADLTAAENLAFAATMLGLPAAEGRDRIPEVLDAVGLRSAASSRVGTFSAGMRRRLALGRIVLGRPSLVLLDEPHAALDPDGMALVDRLLAGWREVGVTTIVASHQVERDHRHRGRERRAGRRDRGRRWRAMARSTARRDGTRQRPRCAGPPGSGGTLMARGLAVAMAVARKDGLSELRGRQAAGSTLFFAAIVLLLFGFALGPDSRPPGGGRAGPAVAGDRVRRVAHGCAAAPAGGR